MSTGGNQNDADNTLLPEFSEFSSRVGTNYVPTDEELAKLQGLLIQPRAKLRELEEEMEKLLNRWKDLSVQRDSFSKEMSQYSDLTSPMRRVPVDVLQCIFILCLPTHHNAVISKAQAPFLITQVCSLWRHVAFTTPRLWASLHIAVPPEKSYSEFPYQSSRIAKLRSLATSEWLRRSGECPIDISMHDGEQYSNGPQSYCHWHTLINTIIPFSRKWRKLLITADAQALESITSLSPSDVPLLESLEVNDRGHYRDPIWRNSHILLAPRLTKVTLVGTKEEILKIPLQWSYLTNLTLAAPQSMVTVGLTISELAQILTLGTQLVECNIVLQDVEVRTSYSRQIITVPALRRLSIGYREGNILSILFQNLRLPSLQEFSLKGVSKTTRPNTSPLLHLFPNVSATLRSFSLYSEACNREDLFKILQYVPHLVKLSVLHSDLLGATNHTFEPTIPIPPLDDEFLARLNTPTIADEYLLPKMEELILETDTILSDAALLDFVLLRQSGHLPGVRKLKKVSVSFRRPQVSAVLSELKSFLDEGLILTLDYRYVYRPTYNAFAGLPTAENPFFLAKLMSLSGQPF